MPDPEIIEYEGERSRRTWVTVASFSIAGMANIAKLQLDSEEIPNFIDNELPASTLWHLQPAIGGMRLKVPEEYEEEAMAVLRNEDPDEADQDGEDDDADESEYADQGYNQLRYASPTRCPKCHADNAEIVSWPWRIVQTMVILFLGVFTLAHVLVLVLLVAYATYFLFSKPNHRCLSCYHRFNAG